MLELVGDFFGRKECVGAGMSGEGPCGVHEAGGAPGGWARPVPSWIDSGPPWCVLCTRNSKIFLKNHIQFLGHLENFYFRGIFYCKDN